MVSVFIHRHGHLNPILRLLFALCMAWASTVVGTRTLLLILQTMDMRSQAMTCAATENPLALGDIPLRTMP